MQCSFAAAAPREGAAAARGAAARTFDAPLQLLGPCSTVRHCLTACVSVPQAPAQPVSPRAGSCKVAAQCGIKWRPCDGGLTQDGGFGTPLAALEGALQAAAWLACASHAAPLNTQLVQVPAYASGAGTAPAWALAAPDGAAALLEDSGAAAARCSGLRFLSTHAAHTPASEAHARACTGQAAASHVLYEIAWQAAGPAGTAGGPPGPAWVVRAPGGALTRARGTLHEPVQATMHALAVLQTAASGRAALQARVHTCCALDCMRPTSKVRFFRGSMLTEPCHVKAMQRLQQTTRDDMLRPRLL